MLSRKIDRILIADDVTHSRQTLQHALTLIAPHAEIQIAHDRHSTWERLAHGHPVLALLRLNLIFDVQAQSASSSAMSALPLPPFLIGIASVDETALIIQAMQFGFNHVLRCGTDSQCISREIQHTVATGMPLIPQLNRLLAPRLYNDEHPFDLKQLNLAIEQQVFQLACRITRSKNGISKLLGISRQLVQYHLKKMQD